MAVAGEGTQPAEDARGSGRRAWKAAKRAARRDGRATRSRWPWLLGAGLVAAGAVYTARARAASQVPVEQELPAAPLPRPGSPQSNGNGQHAHDGSTAR